MEEENKKNTKGFYITLALMLAVVAILIIASIASKRSNDTPGTTDTEQSSTEDQSSTDDSPTISDTDKLPEFSLPVSGNISIDYSDTVPVFSITMGDYRTHLGVDIEGELGTEVLAVADGIVTNVWDDPFMGTCISIEHSGNAVSIYKNLDPVVKEGIVIGCEVKSGDVIGVIGESAMNEIAQEPHLHYELKVADKHVDPKDHFKFPSKNNTQDGSSSSEESSAR
ncbi:MAG: M23 family metallopeptidase [Clostridia bacterium]|nr:M23 family metallopeptidase [Clostridia bacterium]